MTITKAQKDLIAKWGDEIGNLADALAYFHHGGAAGVPSTLAAWALILEGVEERTREQTQVCWGQRSNDAHRER